MFQTNLARSNQVVITTRSYHLERSTRSIRWLAGLERVVRTVYASILVREKQKRKGERRELEGERTFSKKAANPLKWISRASANFELGLKLEGEGLMAPKK